MSHSVSSNVRGQVFLRTVRLPDARILPQDLTLNELAKQEMMERTIVRIGGEPPEPVDPNELECSLCRMPFLVMAGRECLFGPFECGTRVYLPQNVTRDDVVRLATEQSSATTW